MDWIKTTDRLPEFEVPVLVYCRIYGRFIATYDRLAPDLNYGNWRHNEELGILPPLYWMHLPLIPLEEVKRKLIKFDFENQTKVNNGNK